MSYHRWIVTCTPIRTVSHLAPRCALITALLSVALLGCPGNLDDPDRFKTGKDGGTDGGAVAGFVCPSANVKARDELIIKRCANAGCHDGTSMAGGLDLKSPDVLSRMKDIPSASCTNKVLITPDGGGYFFEKLRPMPTCGTRMPLTGNSLTATEEQCLGEWANHVLAGGAE